MRRNGASLLIALVAGALALGAAVAVAAPSSAEPTDPGQKYAPGLPDGLTAADLELGDRLEAAVATIRAANAGEGYNAVVPNKETMQIAVRWKEPLPKDALSLDGKELNGFVVHLQAVRYSEADLVAASDRVVSAAQDGTVPEVASATGLPDGSGLEVRVPQEDLATDEGAINLAEIYTKPANMHVEVVPGSVGVPTSRQNDSDPWYGGGMMEAPGFNPPNDLDPYQFCSNAFAVVTDTGFGRLLTALHCGDCDIAWKDGHHDPLTNGGTDVDCHARDDSQLIDPIGGTDGWVHGGPWDATSTNSRYHLKVAAATSSFFGEFVCSSGANSGEHCGTLSTKNSNIVTWGCGSGTCHGWQASKPGSPPEANVVGGDSGGPVYHPRDDGRVGARGVIWGGAINGSCGSVRFAVTNCFKEVWFNDIVDITTYDWTTVTVETTP